MQLQDKIAGALAGMVLGDALGMPSELWPREKIRKRFGYIDSFLDGPEDNIVACYFKAGQYTDDSAQALVILNALLEYKTVPKVKVLADKLLDWVYSMNGFEINLLGASSKASLLAHSKGEDYTKFTKIAATNGAAMRIAPVGCIIPWNKSELLAKTVAKISVVTHGTDVAIAGASMIAQAVASALANRSFDEIIEDVCTIHDIAIKLGEPSHNASCKKRLEMALRLMKDCKSDEDVSLMIYETVGTTIAMSESVPAALAVAYYCRDPKKAAIMCANMGGDTDTIGSMATAICGAYTGITGIPGQWLDFLIKVNKIDFNAYSTKIMQLRDEFTL